MRSLVQVWLGVVGDGDECHVEHDLAVEPAGFDGEFPHDDTGDDAERGAEHTRSVEGGEAESVDGKLQDQDLEDQGDVDRIFDQNEAEDLRYPCRVLHKEQKEWNHEDSQQCDQYTGYFQVDSGDWWK